MTTGTFEQAQYRVIGRALLTGVVVELFYCVAGEPPAQQLRRPPRRRGGSVDRMAAAAAWIIASKDTEIACLNPRVADLSERNRLLGERYGELIEDRARRAG